MTPGTLLHRRLAGDDWSLDQHLLAIVADRLAVANWQRSKDGHKESKRPVTVSPLAKRSTPNRSGDTAGRDPREVMAILAAHRG